MSKYPWEYWGSCLRLLPTAGVCDQRSDASLRLLLTAGVCEQHIGGYHRLLLTAGVCEQHLGGYYRLLLTAGVCQKHLDTSLRLLNFGLFEFRGICLIQLASNLSLKKIHLTVDSKYVNPQMYVKSPICFWIDWQFQEWQITFKSSYCPNVIIFSQNLHIFYKFNFSKLPVKTR